MSSYTQRQAPDANLVAYIYAGAASQAIAAQDGPSFEEILAQSIEAAKIFEHKMADRHSQGMGTWLGSLSGMK